MPPSSVGPYGRPTPTSASPVVAVTVSTTTAAETVASTGADIGGPSATWAEGVAVSTTSSVIAVIPDAEAVHDGGTPWWKPSKNTRWSPGMVGFGSHASPTPSPSASALF